LHRDHFARDHQFTKIDENLILARLHRARLGVGHHGVHEVRWQPATGEEILVVDRAAFDSSLARQAIEAGARLGCRLDPRVLQDLESARA